MRPSTRVRCHYKPVNKSSDAGESHPVETSVVFILTLGSTPCTQVGESGMRYTVISLEF